MYETIISREIDTKRTPATIVYEKRHGRNPGVGMVRKHADHWVEFRKASERLRKLWLGRCSPLERKRGRVRQ